MKENEKEVKDGYTDREKVSEKEKEEEGSIIRT